jgi:hypothetical protein
MGHYTALIIWERNGAVFTDNRYGRGHRWQFDGGVEVLASSSPHVVPPPLSVAAAGGSRRGIRCGPLQLSYVVLLVDCRQTGTLD